MGQFSGRLAVLDERVILRGSYAESFKAPSLDALYSPTDLNTEPGGFYVDPAHGHWEANGYVNFSDGCDDIIPDVIARKVSSYRTFDAQVAYDFGDDAEGFPGGTRVYFGIENLIDPDPPFVASSSD